MVFIIKDALSLLCPIQQAYVQPTTFELVILQDIYRASKSLI